MSLDSLVAPLSRLDIFRGLDAVNMREIVRRAERVIYKPGDLLIEDGCPGDAAILIVTGTAVRVSGPALTQRAEPVPPGSLLGEMAMVIETEHSSTVIARSPVRALRLLRSDILEHMEQEPRLAEHFVSVIASRLSMLAGHLRSVDRMLSDEPDLFDTALASPRALTDGREMRVH